MLLAMAINRPPLMGLESRPKARPSSRMLNMGASLTNWAGAVQRLFFGLGFGLFELLDVFGWILFEVLDAVFATKLDLAIFIFVHDGFAHLAEFFAGNDASLQRIRLEF